MTTADKGSTPQIERIIGDGKLLAKDDAGFADCKCPLTNGSCASLNQRGCDSMHQEWQCGTNGWYRTGNVCPR